MNYYETLYIVHPALEAGRLKDIILSLDESLKKIGGTTLSIELWGKKRLAYLIDKQKYGTYVQLQFTGEGNCTSSFEMELEHNPDILSYLTTLIKESDVVKQENDLDSQIAGQSREVQKDPSKNKTKTDGRQAEKSETDGPPIPPNKTDGNERNIDHVEKSAQTNEGEDKNTDDDVDAPNNKLDTDEVVSPKDNMKSVKEKSENADEKSEISEE